MCPFVFVTTLTQNSLQMLAVITHELAHVLVRHIKAEKEVEHWAEEGVCQLYALRCLQRLQQTTHDIQESTQAAQAAQMILDDPSEAYGGGLRLANDLASDAGVDGVLNRLRHTGTILPR